MNPKLTLALAYARQEELHRSASHAVASLPKPRRRLIAAIRIAGRPRLARAATENAATGA
jgi:hypothetical protein